MTNRERERMTLGFNRIEGRGAVEETFYPWDLTTDRFKNEGLPADIADSAAKTSQGEKYLEVDWGKGVMQYEQYLGFDPVWRIHFALPFSGLEEKAVIETKEDWRKLKEGARKNLDIYFTDEAIENKIRPLYEGHERGEYSIRLNLEGFFWAPRELMGIEQHLYNFYDEPEMMHDINAFILEIYLTKLMKVIDIAKPDVVYLMEDLSGKNGPMISGDAFDEFVGSYYRRLIPVLKEHGVGNVFVDTDGDFAQLIPNFIAAGVEGFLPMDVNAGMDITKIRKDFPKLKFIGGFNKLCIAKGKEAIDREFDRILPVIRGGGYVPGSDHQVAPSTSYENYRYYISKLAEMMKQAGADL